MVISISYVVGNVSPNSSSDITLVAPAGCTFSVVNQRPIGRPYSASLHFPGELENDAAPGNTSFARCSFGWTRTCNFLWSTMEPKMGDFSPIYDNSDYSNRFLGEMESINTSVLPLIDGPPAWLNDSSSFYITPQQIPLLCQYVNKTVTHFQNRMKVWELFNEPNNGWGNTEGTWDEFFAVLIAAAKTIKLVNTSLEVLVGGLGGYRELDFLDSLMSNLTRTKINVPGYQTAKDLFIGIAFHPYTNPPEDLAVKLMQYDQILAKYNWTNADGARHWITEIGGETDNPRDGAGGFVVDPEREFAAMLIKQMAIATSWDVDGFNIWTYRDFEPPGQYTMEFSHNGIVYYNASWKMATYACNWTNRFLGNGHMTLMPVSFPQPLAGIVAKDSRLVNGKERWVIVAWNPQHQGNVDVHVDFKSIVSDARSYDYTSDASTNLLPSNDTGLDTQLSYEPVLLVVDCDVGGSCSIVIHDDPVGTIFNLLLLASAALIAGNIICIVVMKLKKKVA
ncbi:MAG TPA: hypothetical protein VKM55_15685 [Candidatus Lokiarchaeia archaeon]|nr:hypothetical protein [Candidatus Lokiarchaeia archaeon]